MWELMSTNFICFDASAQGRHMFKPSPLNFFVAALYEVGLEVAKIQCRSATIAMVSVETRLEFCPEIATGVNQQPI